MHRQSMVSHFLLFSCSAILRGDKHLKGPPSFPGRKEKSSRGSTNRLLLPFSLEWTSTPPPMASRETRGRWVFTFRSLPWKKANMKGIESVTWVSSSITKENSKPSSSPLAYKWLDKTSCVVFLKFISCSPNFSLEAPHRQLKITPMSWHIPQRTNI